ncbi:hypothetical protein TBLA_0H00340 [Henningerozyma blattae CBS 6284]|uniref:V-type ATPase assembly factor PKR1 n=1 Tax=Henningerozyma blattae (strain ATCC 34711 / CBS 6284 / DSM 70876 / NBRC 10599 / NRRL Y-10934 / UCD 77-7) TaxID=1071380 RepID=I2H7H5_HENB6|nr:hypothetical protein TBLA_0H00340 [Tetrapisispora blattae CBS 6284]CCH62327.1 hypothetical protein TBLA_0H00340 [Tetrapisispora blattae CBS 6284]
MSIQSLIIKSITEPGANDAVVIAIHITFCSLLAVLASMVFVTRGNIHYIFLFFIAAILYGILTWFISEIKKIQAEEKKEVKSMSKDVYDNDTQVTKNSSTDDAKSSLKNLGKSMSE